MTSHTHASAQARIDVERLLHYAIQKKLIDHIDLHAMRNTLLDLLHIPEPDQQVDSNIASTKHSDSLTVILDRLLTYAYESGVLTDHTQTQRDLWDTRIMGILTPRPSQVNGQFWTVAHQQSIQQATDYFYQLSIDVNYIRMNRVAHNEVWLSATAYGDLEITINVSKPEKDPKEIAMLKSLPKSHYPRCALCVENVGYAGRLDHPARQNLRVVPIQLAGEAWCMQFSPYVYYQEHCIIFNEQHVPMKISHTTFERILDFVNQFPHYFVGSNSDLPIVGGSILNHDHFQGGNHVFPMEVAPVEQSFTHEDFSHVRVSIVKWPMSVMRLTSNHKEKLIGIAQFILEKWQSYSDSSVDIIATSQGMNREIIYHHTVTPIGRMNRQGEYELDIVLRDNGTSPEHPEGIFHPHRHLHHIKRENIGLIEVMGLAVLPGRLQEELREIAKFLTGEVTFQRDQLSTQVEHSLHKHIEWIQLLITKHGTQLSAEAAKELLRTEVGLKFSEVLEHAGVFKRDTQGQDAFVRFIRSAGFQEE
jgi:UDPglucose--hexose-1-phosphate uridylyltransferase